MDPEIDLSKEQLIHFQGQIAALEDALDLKNTQIVQLNIEITEYKLKIREMTSKIENLEMEINNKKLPRLDKPITEFSDIESPLRLLEAIIEEQRMEISSLTFEKSNLINAFRKMDQVLSKNENILNDLISENEKHKTGIEQQKEDFDNKLLAMSGRWKKSLQRIRNILPQNIQLSEDFEQIPPEDAIIYIVDSFLKYSDLITHSNNNKINNQYDRLRRRHEITVGHLKNLVEFIKKLSGSLSNENNARKDILVECGRISTYIDTEETCGAHNEMSSIFDLPDEAHSLEKVAKLVLKFIEDDKRPDTPYEEMLLLITTILKVNKMLYNQNQVLRQVKPITPTVIPVTSTPVSDFDQNETIKNLRMKYEDLNSLVINTLAPYIPDPQNSGEEILKQFNSTARFSTKEEREDVAKYIKKLEYKLQSMANELEEANNRHDSEKADFCENAKRLLNNIHRNVSLEMNKKDILIKEQKSQLEKYIQENTMFKTTSASQHKEVNREIRIRDDKISDLRLENEGLKKELDEARKSLTATTEESSLLISNLKAEKHDLEERVVVLYKDLENQTQRHKYYKARLVETVKQNSEALNDIRNQNQKLTEKFDGTIQALEADLESARVQNVDFKQQIDQFSNIKQNLMMRIAKHQVSERSLNLKVQSLSDTIDRIKQQYEERIASVSQLMEAGTKNHIENLNQAIGKAVNVLRFILKKEFMIEEFNKEETFDELVRVVTQKFQDKSETENDIIIKDAIKTRKIVGINRTDPLEDTVKKLLQDIKDVEFDIERTVKENENLVSKISELEHEINKSLEAKLENSEWEKWIRALYVQVIGAHDNSLSINVAKKGLHEYILSLVKQESLFRKLEILKIEKKALLKQKSLVTARFPRCTCIPSTRPFMMAFIFLRRVQIMSGTLQNDVLSKEAGADFASSRISKKPLVPVK